MAHLYMIDDLPMKNVEFSIATLNYQNVRVLLEPKKLESETPIVGMTQVISRSGNKKGGSGYNPSYKMLQAG